MNRRQDIQEELESISSYMAAMPHSMPYDIPVGYFEQFGDTVKDDVMQRWGQSLPYVVPVGYFDDFAGKILALAASDADSQSKRAPYTTPTGYFDTLPEQMLRTVNAPDQDKTTRIIPMKRHRMLKPLKWAAAAVVLMGMSIGAYFTTFNTRQDTGTEKILASISNSEIQEYVQGAYRVDVNRIVSNNDINEMPLDNNDIVAYLDETGWD